MEKNSELLAKDDLESLPECGFCSMPLLVSQNSNESEEVPEYCSATCEDSAEDEEPLPDYKKTFFFKTGVGSIDASLPQGMPRDAFIVISGEPGTRSKALLVELAWRRLEKDEPVILVTASDPPLMMLEQFLNLKWNIFPHLESGNLCIIDCYSHQNQKHKHTGGKRWSNHLRKAAKPCTKTVHDPGQPKQLMRQIHESAEELGLNGSGAVIFDSLTEIGSLMQNVAAYNLIKTLRADICKGRDVTLFAGANFTGNYEEYPHEMEFLFDGIIDLALSPKSVSGYLFKQMIIRKMRGVMAIRNLKAYEFVQHNGLVQVNYSENKESEDEDTHGSDPTNPSNDKKETDSVTRNKADIRDVNNNSEGKPE